MMIFENFAENKTLSVIIVNFKSERSLEECVASFYNRAGSDLDFEIIVVNNDKDEDLSGVKKKFPEVSILISRRNTGFGSAGNLGANSARGKYLLFLNPDAKLLSGNISGVISEFEKIPGLGIIGAGITNEAGNIQEWTAGFETGLWDIVRNNAGFSRSRKIWMSRDAKDAHWVAGTAFLTRKDLFLAVGGFDEKFFMYFEDADLCKRIRSLGQRVLYLPDFKVMHRGGESYQGNRRKQKIHYYDSMEYYFKKHRNFLEWLAVKLLRKIHKIINHRLLLI